MQHYPYDSRDTLYKSIFGAIAAGTDLRLRLLLHRDARVTDAFLCIEKDGEQQQEILLYRTDSIDDYDFYECNLTLSEGLYWYSFRYDSDYGIMYVTKSDHSLGTVSPDGGKWQLTVYEKDFKTPDWIKGGIIYQIFPDRFYNSGKPKANVPNDRFIQTDMDSQPAFLQDGNKRCLGNDYYCGDIAGIEQKLSYLKGLGVSCIYLNPIFEAHSNHRYNTADYTKIDSLLGNEDDLKSLCSSAKKLGIRIIIDGVFSHTGDDSVYFNKHCRYGTAGAFNDFNSPYRSWYNFRNWPNEYSCWWGVPSLPETHENDPSFNEFINGENGIIRRWLACGISGWRLDVADELPDSFLCNIRNAAKSYNPDAFILGEVWEDATNKISYGVRRKFLRGSQLDSVMNYPLADAIVKFVKGGNARDLIDLVLDQLENYPLPAVCALMNHIGSHDTARILTRLGTDEDGDRAWQSARWLSDEEKKSAKQLLRLAAALQYTLPGVPSLYYGDEAGMEGFSDPFCRAAYPWGNEDTELIEFYRTLGKIRRGNSAFKDGTFTPLFSDIGYIAFVRSNSENSVLVAVNRWCEDSVITVPENFTNCRALYGKPPMKGKLRIPAFGFVILKA